MKFSMRPERLILLSALFLTAFANFAFFRNLYAGLSDAPWWGMHLGSLGVILYCLLVILLFVTTPGRALKPVLVFMFLLAAVAAYFMDTYNVIIDADMLANALQTDAAEAADLLSFRMLAYLLLVGVLPSVLLVRAELVTSGLRSAIWTRLRWSGVATLVAAALVLVSSAFYSSFVREHKNLRYYANPLTPIYSVYKYARRSTLAAPVAVRPIGEDAHIPAADKSRELVVLVVGETARTDRFSLNGYPRRTNPELEQRGVISFTGMSACGTSTAISVPCMFSLLGADGYSKQAAAAQENLLDVLSHAGIHVLWRDNNSSSKGVAERVPEEDFSDPGANPVCDVECRDEGMLAGLQDYIDGQAMGDILVVLHQMGSHGPAYYKRYPPAFRAFKPTCDTNQLDSCSDEAIGNTYDNSILYTDFFLSRVIDLLQANDSAFETALMYVSDHGESLGEAGVYLHGLPPFVAPEEQTSVPVILWFGKNFHAADRTALARIRHQPFTHDTVFHTVLGLFEVESGVYLPERDLLALSRNRKSGSLGAIAASSH